MADKAISELTQATEVTDSDLFVLQQGNVAKKLPGSTLKNYVVLNVVSAEAQTLPAGSDATANYDKANKTLKIGVPTGLTGPEGPQGPKGDKGDTGTTAYESAVEGGYSGTELEFYDELANFSALSQQAATSATNAGASATQAGDANTEAQQAKTDIQDSVNGVAQEDTAQSTLALLRAISTQLQTIIDQGGSAGDLNGFSLSLGEGGTVIISYTDPDDETITGSATFPTNDTSAALLAQITSIKQSLAIIAWQGQEEETA